MIALMVIAVYAVGVVGFACFGARVSRISRVVPQGRPAITLVDSVIVALGWPVWVVVLAIATIAMLVTRSGERAP